MTTIQTHQEITPSGAIHTVKGSAALFDQGYGFHPLARRLRDPLDIQADISRAQRRHLPTKHLTAELRTAHHAALGAAL